MFAHMTSPWLVRKTPFVSLLTAAWACVAIFLGLTLPTEAEKPAVEEFEAKAVLVYHFAKFTSWPEGTFKTDQSPILISVYGDKGFYEVLKKYHGRLINGRPLSINYIEKMEEDPLPQILYFTGKIEAAVAYYLKEHSTPTLTIGETKDFVEKGGILSVVRDDDHLTIYSNLKSAVETKLYLNNKLVQLTKQIPLPPDERSE